MTLPSRTVATVLLRDRCRIHPLREELDDRIVILGIDTRRIQGLPKRTLETALASNTLLNDGCYIARISTGLYNNVKAENGCIGSPANVQYSVPPQLTTFPTFHRRLLSSEGIPSSRASRLSCRQRAHQLVFLSSGGGGPITALTDAAEIGPEDDDEETLSFRAYSS